jgi:hypothetical protein
LTYQIPVGVPATLNAGDTWQWTVSPADFPPGQGFTLTYQLTGKTAVNFVAAPNVALGLYSVAVPVSVTAIVAPGAYRWVLRASDTSVPAIVTTADSGHLVVNADPNVTINTDTSSHAQKMLVLIEQELQARVPGTGAAHVSYSIEGRSMSKMTLDELYKLRGRYRGEVARQANGGKQAPAVITFGRRGFGAGGFDRNGWPIE